MAVTILEALQNAQYNVGLSQQMPALLPLAASQLRNAVGLLEKGYDVSTLVEPLIEQYGDVDEVPKKE